MAARTGNSSYTGMHYTREVSVYPIGVFKKRDLSLTAAEPILLPTPASQAMAIGRRRIKEDLIFAGEKNPWTFPLYMCSSSILSLVLIIFSLVLGYGNV